MVGNGIMSIKYAHVVTKINEAMQGALNEVPRRGGMFNWMFVHKGGQMLEMNSVTKEQLEKFDVVQVNLSPADQPLVRPLKEMLKGSSTTLIGNNDFVAECWSHWLQHCDEYQWVVKECDGWFGTEPYQTACLPEGAFCLSHPHDIKTLKHIGNDDLDERYINTGFLYHWWEGRGYIPALMFSRFKKKYPGDVITRIYGYTKSGDTYGKWTNVSYEKLMPMMKYPDFLRSLMMNRFVLENSGYHTYGRTSVDTAAVGIPTLGSNRVLSMRKCFPNMSFDPMDVHNIESTMHKIIKGGSWLDEQMSIAHEECEYFNYDNSRERYTAMYEEIKRRVGK